MLKEIKKESDVITNQDLFNEIIKKVKKSDKWPSSIIDYAEGKVVFDKLEYCILSLVYDGDMLFQGNMMDSIYPDNLIDIDESVGITKEEIFV